MGRLIKLPQSEVNVLLERIENAHRRLRKRNQDVKRFRDAYTREPLGNERDGRSAVISSDVHDRVESQHPMLMRRFLATDPRVSFTGPDPLTCKIAKVLCRETIHDQGSFLLFTDALKDGAVTDIGVAKVFWRRIWGKPQRGVTLGPDELGLTSTQIEDLAKSDRYKIVSLVEVNGPEVEIEDPGDDVLPPEKFVISPEKRYAAVVKYRPLLESGPVIDGLPSEEFLHAAGKRRMDDRHGCGHIRKLQVGEILRDADRLSSGSVPYFQNLQEALKNSNSEAPVADTQRIELAAEEREAIHYDPEATTEEIQTGGTGPDGINPRGKRWYTEWCDWVVDKGKLIPAITTFIGKICVRCEENDEGAEPGMIPYIHWTPIPYSYSMVGAGLGRLHADDQIAVTLLKRAYFDGAAFAIDQVLIAKQGSGIDELALMELYPGKVITGDPDGVAPLKMPGPPETTLQAIEMMKGDMDERGTSTRMASMGTDMPNYNKTATAFAGFQRASFNKSDLVALAFAEMFLAPAYTKIFALFQRHLDKPRIVKIDGEEIVVTKEKLKGNYRARAEVGLDVDFDDREYMKAGDMLMKALMVVKGGYPMLFPPDRIGELTRRVFLAGGEPDPGLLIDIEAGKRVTQQAQMAAAMSPTAPPMLPPGAPPSIPPGSPPAAGAPVPPLSEPQDGKDTMMTNPVATPGVAFGG